MTGTDFFMNTNSEVTIRKSNEGEFIKKDSIKVFFFQFCPLKATFLLSNRN